MGGEKEEVAGEDEKVESEEEGHWEAEEEGQEQVGEEVMWLDHQLGGININIMLPFLDQISRMYQAELMVKWK